MVDLYERETQAEKNTRQNTIFIKTTPKRADKSNESTLSKANANSSNGAVFHMCVIFFKVS